MIRKWFIKGVQALQVWHAHSTHRTINLTRAPTVRSHSCTHRAFRGTHRHCGPLSLPLMLACPGCVCLPPHPPPPLSLTDLCASFSRRPLAPAPPPPPPSHVAAPSFPSAGSLSLSGVRRAPPRRRFPRAGAPSPSRARAPPPPTHAAMADATPDPVAGRPILLLLSLSPLSSYICFLGFRRALPNFGEL